MTSTIWLDMLGSGVQERYHDAGGVRTRVVEMGSGPPLLLLHGTGGHVEAYCRNLPALATRFRVLAVDMVGHGFTDCPDLEYCLDDYADHLLAVIDALDLDRVHVSGESLGAMVAGWFAIKYPERAASVVMNTGILAQPGEEAYQPYRDLERRTNEMAEAELTRDAVRRRLEWVVSKPERMTEEMVEVRYRIYSQPGMLPLVARIMSSVLGMLRGERRPEYLAPGVLMRIQCPILVIWTEDNPGQPLELARAAVADLDDVRLHVVPDSGHWPQFEQPDEVNRLHLEFLDEIERAAAPA